MHDYIIIVAGLGICDLGAAQMFANGFSAVFAPAHRARSKDLFRTYRLVRVALLVAFLDLDTLEKWPLGRALELHIEANIFV